MKGHPAKDKCTGTKRSYTWLWIGMLHLFPRLLQNITAQNTLTEVFICNRFSPIFTDLVHLGCGIYDTSQDQCHLHRWAQWSYNVHCLLPQKSSLEWRPLAPLPAFASCLLATAFWFRLLQYNVAAITSTWMSHEIPRFHCRKEGICACTLDDSPMQKSTWQNSPPFLPSSCNKLKFSISTMGSVR